MSLQCGIVGLPNVGKSTLFNALTQTAAAQAANYPFCTIEPNIGKVEVPDNRLKKLAALAGSQKIIANQIEFVDIAGLVKGASKGEGLGNKFLSNIREVDMIVYVLRCFENDDITHVEGSIDPLRDAEIIETELILADMESLEKRIPNLEKKARGRDEEAKKALELINKTLPLLQAGKPAITADIHKDDKKAFKMLGLLTSKPFMYVCNMNEDELLEGNDFSSKVEEMAKHLNAPVVRICANIEEEISQLESDEEKQEFLQTIGLEEPSLNVIIRTAYNVLGLDTFFTVGPKEARAWTVKKGSHAPQAAGVIHTDFERGFIAADTIKFEDYAALGSEAKVKEAGKMAINGKDYIVKDGDIFNFKFNV